MKLISVTTSVYGFHQWDLAPTKRIYLAHPHRHQFIITVYCQVIDSDREIEFHDLKAQLRDVIPGQQNNEGVYNFGGMSCEHIGEAILKAMPSLTKVEVSEDGECSAIIKREKKKATMDKPYVVTLCGSTKFRREYEMAAYILEKLGIAVLSVGGYMHAHNLDVDEKSKMDYDRLHISKISMSDGILVLNRGEYIGRSTASEIAFAHDVGKDIYVLEGDTLEKESIWPNCDLSENITIGINVEHIHTSAGHYKAYWKGEKQFPFIIRNSAMEFAKSMELKLIRNDEKGGWEKRKIHPDLFERLTLEVEELENALLYDPDQDTDTEIMDEAADVGNFAMMIFDNVKNKRHI